METDNLHYNELTGAVSIRGESGRIYLAPLGREAWDECPTSLLVELDELTDKVKDAQRFAAGCVREATMTDLDPRGWR